MKSTCFQGENSSTENICCNHKNPSKVTPPKIFSQLFAQGAWATSPRKRRNRTECPLPPTSDFLQRKKSMKILMKVWSWHGFEKHVKKSNQFPASSQPKSISYNQNSIGFRQCESIHVFLLVSHGCRKCQKLRFRSGQGPWLAKPWIVSFETRSQGELVNSVSMKSCTTCGMKP